MRSMLAGLALSVMVVGLAACGGGGDGGSGSSGPAGVGPGGGSGGSSSGGNGSGGDGSGGSNSGSGGSGGNSAGSGGSGGSNSGGGSGPAVPMPDERLKLALQSGDANKLEGGTEIDLLALAREIAVVDKVASPAVGAVFSTLTQAIVYPGNSRRLVSLDPRTTAPVLVSTDGSQLAQMVVIDGGRALAFGSNVFESYNGTGKTGPWAQLIKESLGWLLSGRRDSLPATIKFADVGGIVRSQIDKSILDAGIAATRVNCPVNQVNDCWKGLDLIILGQEVNNAEATEQVRLYLKSGKPVLYAGVNYAGFSSPVFAALNIRDGDTNLWAGDATRTVPAGRTPDQAAQQADLSMGLSQRITLMDDLRNNSLPAWTGKIEGIDKIAAAYKGTQGAGKNLFELDSRYDYYKYLVLWADRYRSQNSVYDNSIGHNKGEPIKFLRQMAADTWTHAVRTTALAPKSFGEWLPARALTIPVSSVAETIQVTIPNQGSGTTLIGRLAVPGKPVKIEVVDADGVTGFGLRIGNVRRYPNPLPDGGNAGGSYSAPREPGDNGTSLVLGVEATRTYAMGGPLFLNYSGNPQGDRVVTLKITGAAKYGHWDYTQPMSAEDKASAVAAVLDGATGWQTIKLVGGELQEAPNRVIKGNAAQIDRYVYQISNWVFGANHRLHGYHNMPLTAKQTELCTQFGWDCTSRSKHGAPGVQHFVGWWAQCGYACSGNPSDINGTTDAGWGTLHELGHNTVTGMESMYSCGGECNNNIAAGISSINKYYDTTVANPAGVWDNNGGNFNHQALYGYVQAARATGKTGVDLRDDIYTRLWGANGSDNARQAVTVQIGFLYTRERLGAAKPTAPDLIEFMGLVNKGWRLKGNSWDAANKDKYAMGGYAGKDDISNEDGFYVLSSKLIGKDLRQVFEMYGFKLDARALESVRRLNLPLQAPVLYALEKDNANHLEEGVWLDMSVATPAYPSWRCVSGSPRRCTLNP